MGFDFSERSFETNRGRRAALVLTPNVHVTIGPERITGLRAQIGMSEVDRMVIGEARARSERVDLTIFRGRDDDGNGSWGFVEGISEDDASQLAMAMLRSNLPLYRGLMRAGLCLHLHVDWGPVELVAFREAAEELSSELEVRSEGEDADAVDVWILRNLTFFFALSLEKVLTSILPEKLALMEKRMERIQRMVLQLAPETD